MSNVRLRYWELAPEGIEKLRALEHYLNTGSGLDHALVEMVRLRASQLSGCGYCIDLHTAELRKLNETPERIDVAQWRSSDAYTKRERAALAWSEAVTNIQEGHAPSAVYDELREYFTDGEIANLTLVLAAINAWNRMAIALGTHTESGPTI